MPHPRSGKRSYDAERITAEFTPGQLVIGICVTLLLALMLFLLGIPVGKYQRYSDTETANVETPPPANGSGGGGQIGVEPPQEAPTTNARPGQPRPFRPTPFPGEDRTPPGEGTAVPESGAAPAAPTPPEMPEAPAPPSSPEAGGTQAAGGSPAGGSPAGGSPAGESQAGESQAGETPASPAAGNDIDAELSPSAPPIAASAPPVQRPAERGAWGVQVGAFTRESQAQDLRAQLLDREGLRPEIVRSEDGAYFRVIFVGYETRAAAQAVADELKREAAFSGAWVRALQ